MSGYDEATWLRRLAFTEARHGTTVYESDAPVHVMNGVLVNDRDDTGFMVGSEYPVEVSAGVMGATVVSFAVPSADIRWRGTVDDPEAEAIPEALFGLRILSPRPDGEQHAWTVLDDLWTQAHVYVESVTFGPRPGPSCTHVPGGTGLDRARCHRCYVEAPGYVIDDLSLNHVGPTAPDTHPERTPIGPFDTREEADAYAQAACDRYGGGSWGVTRLRAPERSDG